MKLKNAFAALSIGALLFSSAPLVAQTVKKPKPIQLFNGKDMKNWIIKIRQHEVGDNYANTFRVEDGLLKVRYDGYKSFDKQYGHIAYDKPFSAYVLRVQYRFVGEQAPEGEGWAWRNSGAMLHGQDPRTMLKNQDFPISIEGQLLGGDGKNERTTSNLCTPGTNVVMNDKLFTPHCISSKSKTYHGDQWVTADFVVLGDSVIQHILEGQVVLEYNKPQIGGGSVSDYDPAQKKDGQLLKQGYISLQSESHPIDFKKVELYNLEPYMKDPEKLDKIIQQIITQK
ncbi:3-keto-disaccharide hydrolase [Sphingobacterium spiritivorum]|uniref:3-keto-disaccharide hydrolase n=1 Tax=Sphingobacterium spiritivorum TaxID=258 RepID=UPI00191B84EF|nr:DUF1080 domain-containing protein [Sphingobacterium spiritivorum]QQT27019.1 DUF1080 domain-containing protein [Sphingobacterium spiritivorum]